MGKASILQWCVWGCRLRIPPKLGSRSYPYSFRTLSNFLNSCCLMGNSSNQISFEVQLKRLNKKHTVFRILISTQTVTIGMLTIKSVPGMDLRLIEKPSISLKL